MSNIARRIKIRGIVFTSRQLAKTVMLVFLIITGCTSAPVRTGPIAGMDSPDMAINGTDALPAEAPCWISVTPLKCGYDDSDHMYVAGRFVTDTYFGALTSRQKRYLKFDLMSEYSLILVSNISSEETEYVMCSYAHGADKENCEKNYTSWLKVFTESNMSTSEIEIIDSFAYKNEEQKWELHGLGKVSKCNYRIRLRNINEGINTTKYDLSLCP